MSRAFNPQKLCYRSHQGYTLQSAVLYAPFSARGSLYRPLGGNGGFPIPSRWRKCSKSTCPMAALRNIPPGAADRHRRRNWSAVGQGDAGGRGGWPGVGADSCCPKRARSRSGCSRARTPKPWTSCDIPVPTYGPGRDAAVQGCNWPSAPRSKTASITISIGRRLREEDFPKIEAEMAKIVKADEPFERLEWSAGEAIKVCRTWARPSRWNISRRAWPTRRRCRSIGRASSSISAAVPTSPAPAHRRLQAALGRRGLLEGRRQPQQLQRLYGTAWFTKKELDEYLKQVEEAKRRDHRVLGKQLELFTIEPAVGSGLVLWLPKGAIVRRATRELPVRRTDPPRLPAGLHARTSATSNSTRSRAITRTTRTASSRRSRWKTASATSSSR